MFVVLTYTSDFIVRKISHLGRYSYYVDYGLGNQGIVVRFQAGKRYIYLEKEPGSGLYHRYRSDIK